VREVDVRVMRMFVCLAIWASLPAASAVCGEPARTSGVSGVSATRVRLLAPLAKQLVETGRTRSPTFARLLEEIERSNVIVFVDIVSNTQPRSARAGALNFITSRKGDRFLLVRLYPQTAAWLAPIAEPDSLIATLGHELQHALEVGAQPSVRTAADFAGLYRAIGTRVHVGSGEEFDTMPARYIGSEVERDLRERRPLPALLPCTQL
jgi:hypothetical protein